MSGILTRLIFQSRIIILIESPSFTNKILPRQILAYNFHKQILNDLGTTPIFDIDEFIVKLLHRSSSSFIRHHRQTKQGLLETFFFTTDSLDNKFRGSILSTSIDTIHVVTRCRKIRNCIQRGRRILCDRTLEGRATRW